jgi:VWFA-related protein
MKLLRRAGVLRFCLLFFSLPLSAQQQLQPAPASDAANHLVLDVVVTDRAGKAVKGLEEKDFTVLDNGHPQTVLSFLATGGGVVPANVQPAETPVKIILLVDEVNTNFDRVAYEREQIKHFLLQNDGKLTDPMSLAFFSDAGTEIQDNASRDGKALLASFEQHQTALRTNRRSEGFYGAVERFQLALNTLNSLAAKEAERPGRKIVIWISPGWPLLSGPNVQLSAKNEASLFASITSISTALRNARITLYSVNPLGAGSVGPQEFYYEQFLKPVTQAKNAQAGNLALQVLAVHSGGVASPASNDIAGQIIRCIADADAFYTLTVAAAPADQPNAYHSIVVKVATPGLTVRTRAGYYAQP